MKILVKDPAQESAAREFAERHRFPLVHCGGDFVSGDFLEFSLQGISLVFYEDKLPLRVKVDFTAGALAHRRRFGGGKGQAIARAVGLKSNFSPYILDATAGLGNDSYVLAGLGARMTLLERSPVAHLLLADALTRARTFATRGADSGLENIMSRMRLVQIEAGDFMSTQRCVFDVIYLDPMFPERRKSALVKKEMRAFHRIIGSDDDADGLLPLALQVATYRVVVKRPRLAPHLAGRTPTFQINGKSCRFDVYVIKGREKN